MLHFENEIQSKDGLRLFQQGWMPEAAPKAPVCLLHGLGEHSGRYAHVAQALTDAGYALLTFDLRGHGRSGGKRGHFPGREAMLSDIDALLQTADERFPGAPRFLYGHSLGGILALFYTLTRRPALTGVMVTSPGLRTALHEMKFKLWLSRTLGPLLPGVSLPTGLDPQGLSRDPAVVQKYQNDPLVHGTATFAGALFMLGAVEYIFEHGAQFEPPLLLSHGTADPIAYARGSQDFAALAPNATLKLWDGLYHETHNEPEQDQVLAYLIDWLDAQMENAPAKAGRAR